MIGLIPAAGQARRVEPLPCSKELYPVGFYPMNGEDGLRPKVVSHYLLEKMKLAGIERAFIVLRNGKWDIPAYWGDGELIGMHLGYLLMRVPFGPPYTLDQAYPFLDEALVAFGFPDILFQPDDVFIQLLASQAVTRADVVLGLFTAHDSQQMDMVDIDETGKLRGIFLKPNRSLLHYAWICAIWTPKFTEFMHEYLANVLKEALGNVTERPQQELTVGNVFQAAIEHGLRVYGVQFPNGKYLDIGTPHGLVRAMRTLNEGLPAR